MRGARAAELAIALAISASAPSCGALRVTQQRSTDDSSTQPQSAGNTSTQLRSIDNISAQSWSAENASFWFFHPASQSNEYAHVITPEFAAKQEEGKRKYFDGIRKGIKAGQQSPWWKDNRAKFQALSKKVGHNLGFERSCPEIIDWIGNLQFLVVPRLKLAFCYVPKAACTDFKDMINELNGLNRMPGFGRSYMASRWRYFNLSAENITKEQGWKFATFTRDPLERYVAVYGSTCVPTHYPKSPIQYYEHEPECCGRKVAMGPTSWDDVRESFERRALFDADYGLPAEDQHWGPQVEMLHNCGWGKFNPKNLDYRGDISSGDTSQQVKELLSMVHASPEDMKVAEKYFPPRNITGHRNPITTDYGSFYRRRDVVDAVKKLYSADFHLIPGIGKGFTDEVEARM